MYVSYFSTIPAKFEELQFSYFSPKTFVAKYNIEKYIFLYITSLFPISFPSDEITRDLYNGRTVTV
jgi:hypothetical protein